MHLGYRLVLSLVLGVALVSFLFAQFEVAAEKRALQHELELRAEFLGDNLAETVAPLLERDSATQIQRIIERSSNRDELVGIAVYDGQGMPVALTAGLSGRLAAPPPAVSQAVSENKRHREFFSLNGAPAYVYAVPLRRARSGGGVVAVVYSAGRLKSESAWLWRDRFLRASLLTLLIVLATLLILRWSIMGPIARTAEWMRDLRLGRNSAHSSASPPGLLQPLKKEVDHLALSLTTARAAAEKEAKLREAGESLWTAERLRVYVENKLQQDRLFVVSNREPYLHVRRGKSIEAVVPPSGLVTALEPILRACDGVWVAHGSGEADREAVDRRDRLRVPPDEPHYTLRRVWLTKEEEKGYYLGFANEGLWPLCHIAHTRPIFRAGDWLQYQRVNQKFAQALVEEMADAEQPIVLIQDYHFALLPRLIKEQRPNARVAVFWHIPWPNPEAFGICPQQQELLDGLLGADLIGFHIQAHCNNFLETVDHALESRIEWERFAVSRNGHSSLVRPFPISVAFPETVEKDRRDDPAVVERAALSRALGVDATLLGVGVDRVDYTKGILERFRGVERFLEKSPFYQGKFTFVQIGAPSRSNIQRYDDLFREVEAEAERINRRFQTSAWRPIVFLGRQHSHKEIERYYRAANLCLVTSLHDGMNLVAKEFVATRGDEQGVLILSQFTGACRELEDALIVNPYDYEQLAEALRSALEMVPQEQSVRMRRMRQVVKEHNIYRWAAELIGGLSEVRVETPQVPAPSVFVPLRAEAPPRAN